MHCVREGCLYLCSCYYIMILLMNIVNPFLFQNVYTFVIYIFMFICYFQIPLIAISFEKRLNFLCRYFVAFFYLILLTAPSINWFSNLHWNIFTSYKYHTMLKHSVIKFWYWPDWCHFIIIYLFIIYYYLFIYYYYYILNSSQALLVLYFRIRHTKQKHYLVTH